MSDYWNAMGSLEEIINDPGVVTDEDLLAKLEAWEKEHKGVASFVLRQMVVNLRSQRNTVVMLGRWPAQELSEAKSH